MEFCVRFQLLLQLLNFLYVVLCARPNSLTNGRIASRTQNSTYGFSIFGLARFLSHAYSYVYSYFYSDSCYSQSPIVCSSICLPQRFNRRAVFNIFSLGRFFIPTPSLTHILIPTPAPTPAPTVCSSARTRQRFDRRGGSTLAGTAVSKGRQSDAKFHGLL